MADAGSEMVVGPEIVVVDDVSKTFVIRKDNSLKERVVTFGRHGRLHREEFSALDRVSLKIAAGTTVGLMGPNGSGKSTLLKIVGGIIDPSAGSVHRRGRLAALLELGAGFHPDLSGRDNVYLNASILGLTREETNAQFDSIVEFAEIGDFIDTQVKFYSSGMYVRLAFAVAVHTDPDLLLVDEVLAVGDEAFQRKCMDKIRQFQSEGRTIVLVSHSASQVMEICDIGVVMSSGELVYEGTAAEATKVHREILEGRRRERIETDDEVHHPEEAPTPTVAAVSLSAGGAESAPVSPGEQLSIAVHAHVPHDVERWHSSISIDTPQGQQVFGTSTRRLATQHGPTKQGDVVITYTLPELNLAGGQYFINIELSDEEGAKWDVRWQAATFFVPLEFRQTGTVYAGATVAESAGPPATFTANAAP